MTDPEQALRIRADDSSTALGAPFRADADTKPWPSGQLWSGVCLVSASLSLTAPTVLATRTAPVQVVDATDTYAVLDAHGAAMFPSAQTAGPRPSTLDSTVVASLGTTSLPQLPAQADVRLSHEEVLHVEELLENPPEPKAGLRRALARTK